MFYVAHRLFAAHDRQLGALIAARLARQIGAENVFLPFCDTAEEDLQAEIKGRRLFELDRERLDRLKAMLAVLHGPSLDDGVCMEIGYAAALGVPIVVLTTDFQTYGQSECGPVLAFPDPLVETIAAQVVRTERLGPPPSHTTDRFHAFEQRNQAQVRDTVDAAVLCLLDHAQSTRTSPSAPVRPERTVFCEPSPYQHGESWDELIGYLHAGPFSVRQATRHRRSRDPTAGARADWIALSGCDVLVVDVNGPETPPGGALMIGASLATGRRVIAAPTAPAWTFAHGREPNWRNLMIQYSVDVRLTQADALADVFGE